MGAIISMKNREIGRNDFHVRFMRRSYRIRGSVTRIQIKVIENIVVVRISVIRDRGEGQI